MRTISKFQFIRLDDGRVCVRYYDVHADAFQKVCIGEASSVHLNEPLLMVNENCWFSYQDKLYVLPASNKKLLMAEGDDSLYVWEAVQSALPFKALLLFHSSFGNFRWFAAADYQAEKDVVWFRDFFSQKNMRCSVYEEYDEHLMRGVYSLQIGEE